MSHHADETARRMISRMCLWGNLVAVCVLAFLLTAFLKPVIGSYHASHAHPGRLPATYRPPASPAVSAVLDPIIRVWIAAAILATLPTLWQIWRVGKATRGRKHAVGYVLWAVVLTPLFFLGPIIVPRMICSDLNRLEQIEQRDVDERGSQGEDPPL